MVPFDSMVPHSDREVAKRSEENEPAKGSSCAAFEAADVGTFQLYPDGSVCRCSARFSTMFAVPPETPMTRALWLSCVHREDRKRVDELLGQCLADRSDYQDEYRIVHPDGAVRWIAVRARAVEDGDDDCGAALLGIAWDITDRKRIEGE